MSSIEVCEIVEEAVKKICPETGVVKVPIADGGEGTVDAFLAAAGGQRISVMVKGPLFEEIDAQYGILPDGRTAVIEMAAASGLPLVGEKKNPCLTTTYGTGQLMRDALDRGCTRLIVGIGGSATNDGGIGMAAALGIKFLDRMGGMVQLNGQGLAQLAQIDISGRDERLGGCEVLVACDVDNPLYGEQGAAYIYGPQKGADPQMVELLDKNLRHYASLLQRDLEINVQDIPGTGAAGGLGAGLVAFAGAKLQSGIKIILDTVKFEELIDGADLIITGEGKIDGQSMRGKVPVGIAERAVRKGIPVIAVVGDIGDDISGVYEKGVASVFSINRVAVPFSEARLRCRKDLKAAVEDIMRLIKATVRVK